MNLLDLTHCRYLVILAEELNFGRAAARLHISQPPLTRMVAEVERLVGARLFERTTRRVRLTPVGEVFVAEARALLLRADSALENVRAAVRRQSGQLRLAYTPLALQTVLPEILSALREQEHDVNIDLVELSGTAQQEALDSGQVDMGFANESLEAQGMALEDFTSLLLHRESLQVVLPDGHPLVGTSTLRLADLAGETFILHTRDDYPRYYDRVLQACREAGFTPNIYQREARQNCSALVAAGQGILLAPAAPQPLAHPGFNRVSLEPNPLLYWEVWAILPIAAGSPYLETLRRVVQARLD